MRRLILLLTLTGALFAAPLAYADIYKCPDPATGKSKFQDAPCAGMSSADTKANKVQLPAYMASPKWPVATKNAIIMLCRRQAARLMGVSEAEAPEVGPVLQSCNCIFDHLEKAQPIDYFVQNEYEMRSQIQSLAQGACSPLH